MSSIRLTEQDITPDNSNEGQIMVYAKTDGNLYSKRGDSPETLITTVSAGQGWKHDKPNNKVYLVNPNDDVHIEGTEAELDATQLTLEGRYNGQGTGIDFVSRTSDGGTNKSMAKINAFGSNDAPNNWTTSAGWQDSGFRIYTTFNGSLTEQLRITSRGAVGISMGGGTEFTNKLESQFGYDLTVGGHAYVNGAVDAKNTAKAWVTTTNNSNSIQGSHNVSSVTDGNNGHFTVTFTTNPESEYCVVANATRGHGSWAADANVSIFTHTRNNSNFIMKRGAPTTTTGNIGEEGRIDVVVFAQS